MGSLGGYGVWIGGLWGVERVIGFQMWDPSKFPRPKAMLERLAARKRKVGRGPGGV